MHKILIVLAALSISALIKAQTPAVTNTGTEVILYDDGTWEYVDGGETGSENVIPTNPKKYTRSKSATFLVKSEKLNVGMWLSPKKWSFEQGNTNEDAEFELQLKGEDVYGMLISERVQIPVETLQEIAISNARSVAPDLHVVKEEYRKVNGLDLLFMQMDGTMQGIKFSYYGYYYSNSNGTVQFLTYTAQSLLDTYLDEIELLLNGFVETD